MRGETGGETHYFITYIILSFSRHKQDTQNTRTLMSEYLGENHVVFLLCFLKEIQTCCHRLLTFKYLTVLRFFINVND